MATTVRTARPGTKRAIAIEIIEQNTEAPVDSVIRLIADANKISLSNAKGYYRWLVEHADDWFRPEVAAELKMTRRLAQSTARLFENGGSQAVRLPADYRFEGVEEVRIWRDKRTGDIVLSARPRSGAQFLALRQSLGPLDEADREVFQHRDQGHQKRHIFGDDTTC